MKVLLTALLAILMAGQAFPALIKKSVEYKDGATTLEGYLVYDDSVKGKRPGILLVHEWWGLNSYIQGRAEEVAKLGYVAFAADIYGKGSRPKTRDDAGKFAGMYYNDRKLMQSRALAGLSALEKSELVNSSKLAVMGYCFGGSVSLELARNSDKIAGAVSFHGNVSTPTNQSNSTIKAKVLVLHGADDPFVNQQVVNEFVDSMIKAKVDWQLVQYSGAVHGFTNPDNGKDPSKGLAYNELADKRSWQAMKSFYEELFSGK